jgi:hypothetical protein
VGAVFYVAGLICSAPSLGLAVIPDRITFVLKCLMGIVICAVGKSFDFHNTIIVGQSPVVLLLTVGFLISDVVNVLSIMVP